MKAIHPDEALHKTLREPESGSPNDSRQFQLGQSSFGSSGPRAGAPSANGQQTLDASQSSNASRPSVVGSNLAQAAPALAQIGKLAQLGPLPQLRPGAPVSQIHAGAPSDLKPTQLVPGASQLSQLSADVNRQMRMQIAA